MIPNTLVQFQIFNGCEFDINASCFIYGTNPLEDASAAMSVIASVDPTDFVLVKSLDVSHRYHLPTSFCCVYYLIINSARSLENVRLEVCIEAQEDSEGVLDSEFLTHQLSLPQPQLFAKVSVNEGASYVIPIQYQLMVTCPMVLRNGDYVETDQSQLEPISSLEFGTVVFPLLLS